MAVGDAIATWYEGTWHAGNLPVIGAADHAAWLGSQIFDGARRFEGVCPDLEPHCRRLLRSATAMGMTPPVSAERIAELTVEGCARFEPDTALYLRPMMWAREGSPGVIDIDPASTGFAVVIEALPMPEPGGYSLTVSRYRRPRPETALTEAKAAALYANNGRIMADARARGFHNALSLDPEGYVAETASTNVFMVADGEVFTPMPNGTFLDGITRQRVIGLLRRDGIVVTETRLTVEDFRRADEIFVTGNIAKVMPVARFDERELAGTRIADRARALYWDFAHSRRDAADAIA